MSDQAVKKTRKGKGKVAEVLSWKQKKEQADTEEEATGKEVEELNEWTTMVGTMGEEQLKEYVRNIPEHLKSLEAPKVAPVKRVRRIRKPKSQGIMASVWKFHREDDDDA